MQIVNKTGVVRGEEAPYDRDMRPKRTQSRARSDMIIVSEIPSVNYHLWKACNMRCNHCFATFQDIEPQFLPKGHLGREGCVQVVEAIAEAGFQKINFAGGEPTLCPWLPDLIMRVKGLGLTTSVVTNGSRISQQWLESVEGSLDWVALSIDSVNTETLLRTGRTTSKGPMSELDYLRVVDLLRQFGIRVKINTVVMRSNLMEDLTDFILEARPERWKLLQVLPVRGQNDGRVDDQVVTTDEFLEYAGKTRRVGRAGVAVVPESNDLITGSYVMVDPAGRFFDNVAGHHTYSRPILEVGVEEALRDVSIALEKFLSRGGSYDW